MNYDPPRSPLFPSRQWADHGWERSIQHDWTDDEIHRYLQRRITSGGAGVSGNTATTGYIAPIDPKPGERWYVEEPASNRIETVQIIDVTTHTIEIKRISGVYVGDVAKNGRYRKGFIKFVEKIQDAQPSKSDESDIAANS